MKYKYSKCLIASLVCALMVIVFMVFDLVSIQLDAQKYALLQGATFLYLMILSLALTVAGWLFSFHGTLENNKTSTMISFIIYIAATAALWQQWIIFLPTIVLEIMGYEHLEDIIQENVESKEEYREFLRNKKQIK